MSIKNEESTVSYEQIEREQQLMEDAAIWKHQYEVYKNENDRLNKTLVETQKDLKKAQGDLILAKAFIKAVL